MLNLIISHSKYLPCLIFLRFIIIQGEILNCFVTAVQARNASFLYDVIYQKQSSSASSGDLPYKNPPANYKSKVWQFFGLPEDRNKMILPYVNNVWRRWKLVEEQPTWKHTWNKWMLFKKQNKKTFIYKCVPCIVLYCVSPALYHNTYRIASGQTIHSPTENACMRNSYTNWQIIM